MPNPQDIFQLAQQTATQVTASPENWRRFLYTAAHNYHTTYLNQLLIHAQRPDATACATMKYWNEQAHRKVMYGSKSIIILQRHQGVPTAKRVFSMTDTVLTGDKAAAPWEVTDAIRPLLMQVNSVGSLMDRATEQVISLSERANRVMAGSIEDSTLNWSHPEDQRFILQELAAQSTLYMICIRLGIPVREEDFPAFQNVTQFDTSRISLCLGGYVQAAAEPLLDELGHEVILFGHHPFKINNNVTARHELLSATKDSNVIAFMNGHVHYYGNVVEDGVPINYITYIKDNPNQDFVTIEFSENYYYIYKRKATDHSKELWLSGRMNNTRKLRMTITNITARDNTVDVAVQIENAPDGVKSVQARIDNYGPYTQLIKNEGGIWSGSIDTGLYTPELVAGTHFVGVEAFDNENKKWTEYKDYSTPSDNPTIKWVFETGDSIQSSATINEANVYVGSNDGNLYCIDRDTGSQKWCIQTGNFVISKPAITSEGKIVFGSGDEFVYCASADDGNIIWNTKLGGSVLSDPLTSEGRVFIGCGDGKIYCLNSASGEIVWEYQTDGLMRQRPILENGILYAFVRDTYIWYAIDASTGQLIWRGNANTDESLFVCGDVRPVIANGKLWCIDAQNTRPAYLSLDTGELAWTSTLEKVSSRGMTTNGSTVFYSSNSGRQITAFDAETNQVVWQKDLRYDNKDRDLQEMQIDSALVYNGTSLIHVAERGRITALNPDNGEILWCIDAAGYPERVFWSTPEATDGLVIATGIDGKVYAVEYTH